MTEPAITSVKLGLIGDNIAQSKSPRCTGLRAGCRALK